MPDRIISKVLLTIGVLFYVLVIPHLEWNQSHVFNPEWPPHARFHEVWQLFTNISLGIVALWFTWIRGQLVIPAIISICVMGGVIVSHVLSAHVGGDVQSGNLARQVLGLDIAVFVAVFVVATSILVVLMNKGLPQTIR